MCRSYFFMEGLGYKPTVSTKGAFMGWKGDLGGQFGWFVGWLVGDLAASELVKATRAD